MKKSHLLLSIALVCLLGSLGIIVSRDKHGHGAAGDPAGGSTTRDGSPESAGMPVSHKSKARPRTDDPQAMARRQLRERLDALIPPEDPSAESALCEVIVNPGQSIAVGGFKTRDGHTMTAIITPKRLQSDTGVPQYRIETKMLGLDDAAMNELGIDTLKEGGRQRLQQFIPLSSDQLVNVGKQANSECISQPNVITLPDQRFAIYSGTDQSGIAVSGMVSQVADDEGILLRMRLENDARIEP